MEKLSHNEGNKEFKTKKYETFIYIWSYPYIHICTYIFHNYSFPVKKFNIFPRNRSLSCCAHNTQYKNSQHIATVHRCWNVAAHHLSFSLLFSFFCFWTHYTIEYGKKIANCEPLIKTFSCSFSFGFWNFMLVNSPFLHILSPKKNIFLCSEDFK